MEAIKTTSNLFIYLFIYFTKRFHAHKNTHKQTLTDGAKISKQKKKQKQPFFALAKTFKGMEIVCLFVSAPYGFELSSQQAEYFGSLMLYPFVHSA